MDASATLKNVQDLLKHVFSVNSKFKGQVLWRGQRSSTWDLSPSVFRSEQKTQDEQNYIARFQHKAPSRHQSVPDYEDRAGWLFLMQHYRLPTRLLDWTESPLIGSWFASEVDPALKDHEGEIDDADGALYALSPYMLNLDQIGQRVLMLPDDPKSIDSIDCAFSRDDSDVEYVVAVRPSEVDIRLLAQLSVFTLHGRGLDLETLLNKSKFLQKFRIPNNAKAKIRKELKHLGIRESSIYPDLEHLANDVASVKFRRREEPRSVSREVLVVPPRDPEESS